MSVKKYNQQPFHIAPVVPTPEMLRAGADALTNIPGDQTTEILNAWKAMMEAWEEGSDIESDNEECGSDTYVIPGCALFSVPYEPSAEQVNAALALLPYEERSRECTPREHKDQLVCAYKQMLLVGC